MFRFISCRIALALAAASPAMGKPKGRHGTSELRLVAYRPSALYAKASTSRIFPYEAGTKAALYCPSRQYAKMRRRFDLPCEPRIKRSTEHVETMCRAPDMESQSRVLYHTEGSDAKWVHVVYGGTRFQAVSQALSSCIRMSSDMQSRTCKLHLCRSRPVLG